MMRAGPAMVMAIAVAAVPADSSFRTVVVARMFRRPMNHRAIGRLIVLLGIVLEGESRVGDK